MFYAPALFRGNGTLANERPDMKQPDNQVNKKSKCSVIQCWLYNRRGKIALVKDREVCELIAKMKKRQPAVI